MQGYDDERARRRVESPYPRAATGLRLMKIGFSLVVASLFVRYIFGVDLKARDMTSVVILLGVMLPMVLGGVACVVASYFFCLFAPTRTRGKLWLAASMLIQVGGVAALVQLKAEDQQEWTRVAQLLGTAAFCMYLTDLANEVGAWGVPGRLRHFGLMGAIAGTLIYVIREVELPGAIRFLLLLGACLAIGRSIRAYLDTLTNLRSWLLHAIDGEREGW